MMLAQDALRLGERSAAPRNDNPAASLPSTAPSLRSSVPPRRHVQANPIHTVLSMLPFYPKRTDTHGRKRESNPFTRAKQTLLMALGHDDGDDYECAQG